MISNTNSWKIVLHPSREQPAQGAQSCMSPTEPGEGHLNVGGRYFTNPSVLSEGRAASQHKSITQAHVSARAVESSPWGFVWLEPLSESLGFCLLTISINEITAIAVHDV